MYNYAPGSFNWNVVSSSGEALLQGLGLRSADHPYVAISWTAQGRHFTSPYGLYMEGPMAYDHFPRIWYEDALARGYDGPGSGATARAMDRAAITSLFLQSPWGELPAGGRSAHHQWNEAQQCVTFEIHAAKSKAAGETARAAAFKRAAHLSLSSIRRWIRPGGDLQIVKNWVDPQVRHGYESYSYHSQYNLLALAMLAMAFEHAAATEGLAEGPSPADCGGFVFAIDGLHKIIANGGGTYVEIDTAGDHRYDATGLIRIHRKGVPPQLGLSDSLLAASSYTTPIDAPLTTGIGVSWQDSTGTWRTLGEMNPTSAVMTPLIESPGRVAFDVTYSGGLTGIGSVVEHYLLTPAGLQLTTEIPGYNGPLRCVWPVLSHDGRTASTIAVNGRTVSVSQGGAAQTFTAPGAQSVTVATAEYSNHNGSARLATAEYPAGSTVVFLVGNAVPEVTSAGTLHVDLRATSPTAGTPTWDNPGGLGPFTRIGSGASRIEDVAGTGVPGVRFNGIDDGYVSLATTGADLEGGSDRSIEVWAFNPTITAEESLVSWGLRGTTRANQSLNFGNHASWGAVTHFNDDLGWGVGGVPSAGAWHHLAYVHAGGTTARVYVDGVLSQAKTLGGALATAPGTPLTIGAQRNANGALTNGLFFSGSINRVRVHGGALSASQVAAHHAAGPALPPTNATPSLGTLAPLTLLHDTASDPVSISVHDDDTPFDALVLGAATADPTVVPLAGIVFSGNGAQRRAVITPAPGASGATSVTVSVSDGTTSASRTVPVTVLDPGQSWRIRHFGDRAGDDAIASDRADPDHDGVNNLLERASGGDPHTSDPSGLVTLDRSVVPPAILWRRAKAARDLVATLEESTDLSPGSWTPSPLAEPPTVLPPDELTSPVEILRFTPVPNGAEQRYLRVRVSHR